MMELKKKWGLGVKWAAVALAALMITAGCSKAEPEPSVTPTETPSNSQQDPNEVKPDPNEANVDPNETPKEEDQLIKKTVTLFFSDKDLMEMFGVETEIKADTEEDLPKAALEAWMKGSNKEELTNLVPPEVVVEYVKSENGVAHVSFSKEILSANLGSSGEIMLVEQITLIMKQFGYDSTQILVEGKAVESLLGHVTTDKPITAPNPADYKVLK